MSRIVRQSRSSSENIYGTLTAVVGGALWVTILPTLIAMMFLPGGALNAGVYLFYGVAFALFYWISSAIYCATAFGNMILLSEKQFPALHAMVVEGAEELGMKTVPKAFLFNSNGLVNAFARRLLGGRYLFLSSALVDLTSDEQLRFVIGHELGHHAAGHLNGWMHTLRLPAHFVPFLSPAYSRAREYTCDGIGVRLSKDLVASRHSLLMLGCGCGRLSQTISCEAFVEQEALMPPFFGFVGEIYRSHPRLTRRIAALSRHLTRETQANQA